MLCRRQWMLLYSRWCGVEVVLRGVRICTKAEAGGVAVGLMANHSLLFGQERVVISSSKSNQVTAGPLTKQTSCNQAPMALSCG